jgi:hypothetical protein
MNNAIEVSDEELFAKGQDSRDLRVSPDPTEPGMQFIETIDSSGDFFRFVESSTREIANNQRRLFKDGNEHPRASGRSNRSCQRTIELLGGGDTEAGQLCL